MSYEENVSSYRSVGSQCLWPADHVFNPFHGVKAFPTLVFIAGVLPCIWIKHARIWLVVWVIFWLGTMGPFLKLGADRDPTEVIFLGEHVVRMPWTWMFKWVPGMSRMFAPYRMSAMMVVSGVVLLAVGLNAIRGRRRVWVADRGSASWLSRSGISTRVRCLKVFRSLLWRIPGVVSPFDVPQWYLDFEAEGREGIIEPARAAAGPDVRLPGLPPPETALGWSTGGSAALPAVRRRRGGRSDALARGRRGATPCLRGAPHALRESRSTQTFTGVPDVEVAALMSGGDYRWLLVHERGYYLSTPTRGAYCIDALRRIGERFDLEPAEPSAGMASAWRRIST